MPVDSTHHPPTTKLRVTGLWQHTSAAGRTYFTGRMAGVKVLILGLPPRERRKPLWLIVLTNSSSPMMPALDRLIDVVLEDEGMTQHAVALIQMRAGRWAFPVGQPHLMTRDLYQIRQWINDDVPLHGSKPTQQ